MGLDISKIQNAELKKLAYLKDDGNGNLNNEEFVIFKNEAAKMEGVSADDFNQAMGLYTTNTIKTTEVTEKQENDKKEVSYDENDKKRANETFFEHLDNINHKTSRAKLMETMDKKLGNQKDDPRYAELKQALADVLALLPEKYNSLDDIKKQHDTIEDMMKQRGFNDKLHKKVLKEVEESAEYEVRLEAYGKISDTFAAARANKENANKTNEDIMKDIKKDLKKSGMFKDEMKDAYKDFEKNALNAQARQDVGLAILDVEKQTKRGDVKDSAIDALKKDHKWDKYTKDQMNTSFKEKITGRTSYGDIAAKRQARFNTVEVKSVQSKKEILDKLGKNSVIFEALVSNGLITKLDNDNYDLSPLQEVIRKRIGADGVVNRNSKDNKIISERFKLTNKLSVDTQLENLTEKDAINLAKLCGYEIQGKDYMKAAKSILAGFVTGAAAGGIAEATTPRKSIYTGDVNVGANTNIKIDGIDTSSVDLGELPEGSTITNSGAGLVIDIHQFVQVPGKIIKLAKDIAPIALKTGLITAAIELATRGLSDGIEVPVESVYFAETDIDKYAEELRKSGKYNELAPLFITLATMFQKDGKWDVKAYHEFLNDCAGDGGTLNKEEIMGALERLKKENSKEEVKKDENKNENNNAPVCNASIQEQKGKESSETTDLTHIHYRKKGHGWKGLVEAYYPGLVEKCGGLYGKQGAIKALQRELCTDENGNFDKAKFNALITANDIPKEIKMPTKVAGIDRVIRDVAAETNVKLAGKGEYKAAMDKVGRNESVTVKKVGPSTYLAKDGCDGTIASADSKESALANLKKLTGKTYDNEADLLK